MPEFSFRNAGTDDDAVLTASTKDDLMYEVSRHLRQRHNIQKPTQTIMGYLETLVRDGAAESNGW